MKSHSFSSTELKFLLYHTICFLAALFSLLSGTFLICLLFLFLSGLSLPLFMLINKPSDCLSSATVSPLEAEAAPEPEAVAEPEAAPEPEAVFEPEAVAEPEAAPEPEDLPEPQAVSTPETVSDSEASPEISAVISESPRILPDYQKESITALNLNAFCESIMQDFIRLYGISSGQVQILSEEKDISFSTHETLLTLVTRNLMDNAIKYVKCDTGRTARFTLTLSKQDSGVLMIFRNNTNGVPDVEIPSLTKCNYQGSNRISGTGLGLFQTDAAINALHGSLQIKSSPETGFAVYLQLPELTGLTENELSLLEKEDTNETA